MNWHNAWLWLLLLTMGAAFALLPLPWVGLFVVGGIVVAAILIRPVLGLYMLVAAVPFGAVREISLGGMTVGASEALVGLALAAWLAQMIARGEIAPTLPSLTLPLLFFVGAALISLPGALSFKYSFKEILKWIEVLGLYIFATNALDRRQAKGLILMILFTGAAAALHGWIQFFTRSGPEGFLLFDRFMRAYGTFEQPNPYAGYLGLVAPLALSLVLAGRPLDGKHRPVAIVFFGAVCAVVVTAMGMSWSRGAWLGLAASASVVIAVRSRRAAAVFAALVAVGALLLVLSSFQALPDFLTQRFGDILPYLQLFDVRGVEVTDANFAVVERMAHWQAGWQMWVEHPWRGVGIGNYEPVYPAYAIPPWEEPLGHAHNYYLNIAAETGLIGLLAYLLLWGAVFWQAFRATKRASGWRKAVAVGVLGVLVHLSVHNLFDNLFVHNMYAHVAILLALLPVLTSPASLASTE